MSNANVEITQITYKVGEDEYNATPATGDEITAAGLEAGCQCGQEECRNGWVWRCMAGGGGECVWYRTNQVC